MAGEVFGLGDLVSLVAGLPSLGLRPLVLPFHGLAFAYRGSLPLYLCGPVRPVECDLVLQTCVEEVTRQHPWLAGLPHHTLSVRDWARNWAWLDAMERRYGAEHVVHPLPEDWRGRVKISSQFDAWELPEDVLHELVDLGYDNAP